MTPTIEYFRTKKRAEKVAEELGKGFHCTIERESAGVWVLKSRCLLWSGKEIGDV